MNKLKADLGLNSYPIFIGYDIFKDLGEALKLYGFSNKAVVVTDTNVNKRYGDSIANALQHSLNLEEISIPAGERSKDLRMVEKIITTMLEFGCDRKSVVIAFGGGVVGDIAGFAASIFKRGVPYVHVPTTLLAQVDSSIGGKTGVNHRMGKNLIGTFHQPKLVWMDLSFLKTLPKREIICGVAEIIKYGLIRDAVLFETIENHLEEVLSLNSELLEDVVTRCCEIKSEIVAQDEKESGLRMILNYGHTVGHALEADLGYKRISHGEAVLLGMLAESRIALELGILSPEDFKRIKALISGFELKRKVTSLSLNAVEHFMKFDKKTENGKNRFVLPIKIGKVEIKQDVSVEIIRQGLTELK